MKEIPIVIPAYEPDDRLINLCKNLNDAKLENIIVINDGSGKKYDYIYDKIEKEYNCKILKHKVNLGKGRGLKNAFNYILTNYENVIGCVTADSDGQHSVEDIKKMIIELKDNPNDLILGCRNFNDKNVPWKSKLGNKSTKVALNLFCGVSVSDTQTGLRGIPAKMMEELLDIEGERFEFETNMLIECKDKYNIKEVKIKTIYDSKKNHTTHFNPIVDSIKIYKNILKVFLKYIFSSLSSFIIDILLFNYFCFIIKNINVDMYIAISTVIARVISSLYNYLVNHKVVFKCNDNKTKTALKYFALVITQMLISAVFVQKIFIIFVNVNATLIKIIVDTILFLFSFIIQRKIIFKNKI